MSGIGVQCHVSAPVGAHLSHSFSLLSCTSLPVWITELDTSSLSPHVQADDLEACLREAFAHRGVQGVLLWGFWEKAMSRRNAHLVDADWRLTEAGRRLEALLSEWTTREERGVTGKDGVVSVKGFKGEYEVEVMVGGTRVARKVDLNDSITVDIFVDNNV